MSNRKITVYDIKPGQDPVEAFTVEQMINLIKQAQLNPEFRDLALKIIQGTTPGCKREELEAVAKWVKNNIKYRHDTYGVEYLQDAKEILKTKAGDCDDFTIIICSLLGVLGFNCFIKVISLRQDKVFQHVYPVVYLNGKFIAIDLTPDTRTGRPVYHEIGWEPSGITKDFFVQVNSNFKADVKILGQFERVAGLSGLSMLGEYNQYPLNRDDILKMIEEDGGLGRLRDKIKKFFKKVGRKVKKVVKKVTKVARNLIEKVAPNLPAPFNMAASVLQRGSDIANQAQNVLQNTMQIAGRHTENRNNVQQARTNRALIQRTQRKAQDKQKKLQNQIATLRRQRQTADTEKQKKIDALTKQLEEKAAETQRIQQQLQAKAQEQETKVKAMEEQLAKQDADLAKYSAVAIPIIEAEEKKKEIANSITQFNLSNPEFQNDYEKMKPEFRRTIDELLAKGDTDALSIIYESWRTQKNIETVVESMIADPTMEARIQENPEAFNVDPTDLEEIVRQYNERKPQIQAQTQQTQAITNYASFSPSELPSLIGLGAMTNDERNRRNWVAWYLIQYALHLYKWGKDSSYIATHPPQSVTSRENFETLINSMINDRNKMSSVASYFNGAIYSDWLRNQYDTPLNVIEEIQKYFQEYRPGQTYTDVIPSWMIEVLQSWQPAQTGSTVVASTPVAEIEQVTTSPIITAQTNNAVQTQVPSVQVSRNIPAPRSGITEFIEQTRSNPLISASLDLTGSMSFQDVIQLFSDTGHALDELVQYFHAKAEQIMASGTAEAKLYVDKLKRNADFLTYIDSNTIPYYTRLFKSWTGLNGLGGWSDIIPVFIDAYNQGKWKYVYSAWWYYNLYSRLYYLFAELLKIEYLNKGEQSSTQQTSQTQQVIIEGDPFSLSVRNI